MPRILPLLAVLLAGCGSNAGRGDPDCTTDGECPNGRCIDGACEADDDDVRALDALETGRDSVDRDTAADGDSSDVPGLFGAPCSADEECASGYCIDTPTGRACTIFCSGECPDGFECRFLVNSGGDAVRICLPELDLLCQSCDRHADCEPVGVCAEAIDGRFCQTFCGSDDPCPEGYNCDSVSVDGLGDDGQAATVDICRPTSGECVGRRVTNARPSASGGLVVEGEGRNFVMRGRLGPFSYVGAGERYRLVGGF